MSPIKKFSLSQFDLLAQLLVVVGIFFIPLAAGMVNKIFPIAVVCTILAGNWAFKWNLIRKEPVVIAGLVLLAFITIGMLYSQAPLSDTLRGYFKYSKLIFLVFLLPLFVESRWRRIAENVLLVSVFINAVVALLNVHGIPVFGKIAGVVGSYFIHQIYTSALTAFATFIIVNRLIDTSKYRWFYAIFLLFNLYMLFFVYIERTGYAITLALLLVLLMQRLHWKGLIIAVVAIPLLIAAAYTVSPVFHKRINDFTNDMSEYQKNNEHTSIGFRMSFVKYSFAVIKQNPIFGAGTGSFVYLYPKTGGPNVENSPVGHPHNEYIFILFQFGIVGLLLFLIWMGIQMYSSFSLPSKERRLAQGLIVAFFVNGFCNTSLSINSTGMLFIVFLSVYFAAKANKIDIKSR